MPKQAETRELWARFLSAIADLKHPKSIDQTVLGREFGVGQTMVSEYKRGKKNPSLDVARRMAAYGEMCLEYLLTGKGPQRPWGEMDDDFKRLVELWQALDDHHRRELLSVADAFYAKQGGRPRGFKRPLQDEHARARKRSPH